MSASASGSDRRSRVSSSSAQVGGADQHRDRTAIASDCDPFMVELDAVHDDRAPLGGGL